MKRLYLFFYFIILSTFSFAQVDVEAHNKAVGLTEEGSKAYEGQDFRTAISKLSKALEYDREIKDTHLILSHAWGKSGNIKKQREVLTNAKSIFFDDDEIIYYLGMTYYNEHRLEEALKELTEAIDLTKENGEDYPTVYLYYSNRGIIYLKKAMYSDALADFNKSLELNEMNKSVLTNRGYVLYKLKRTNEACKSWLKAKELGESSVTSYLQNYCK
jgi:tetratricopeptide (TPR) repeat protein